MTEIHIKHFPQVEIKKHDLILEISGDDGLLGHLYISKSSIDFLPRSKKFTTISLTWEKFARMMEKVDKKRRTKRKEKKKKHEAAED